MTITVLDPLLSEAAADQMVALWHSYESYGQYSNEGFDTNFAPELSQRYDAAVNFVRTGGRFGRVDEGRKLLAARTNYFRETYFYLDHAGFYRDHAGFSAAQAGSPAIEAFRDDERLLDAARALHGRPVTVPAIVYANLLLPGQELAVHTDVPEFRGANRRIIPQWLLVVMRHSELFEGWRMRIATGIAYFGDAKGGDLAYYPDGASGGAAVYQPRHNTAALLDTDSVFHGVDRVAGDEEGLARLKPGMRLHHDGDRRWSVRGGDGEVVAEYGTDDLRYSVSWKAYCFADEAEREAWANHTDDLALDVILDTLLADLRRRGVLGEGERPVDAELGKVLIDTYVQFPAPVPA